MGFNSAFKGLIAKDVTQYYGALMTVYIFSFVINVFFFSSPSST